MPTNRNQQGFILMIVMMVLMVLAVAVFAFMRVRDGQTVTIPDTPLTEERSYGN